MLKKILIGVAAVLVGLGGFIASRPASFTVTRSATVAAPADVAFALVHDFHGWDRWSPWEKLDPAMKKTYEGTGVGAVYRWDGNDEVGAGQMKILSAKANERVDIELSFSRPWESRSQTLFTFGADGTGTKVVWTMTGEHNFVSKAMWLVMDMDAMLGKDFEQGLSALKSAAEADAAARAAAAAAPVVAEPTP